MTSPPSSLLTCGNLVCSLTLSQQQPCFWLIFLSLTQPLIKGGTIFSFYLSRRKINCSIRMSINGWYVLDFLGWYWAANTPPCEMTWPNNFSVKRVISSLWNMFFIPYENYLSNLSFNYSAIFEPSKKCYLSFVHVLPNSIHWCKEIHSFQTVEYAFS
jgi:hypothetical protein